MSRALGFLCGLMRREATAAQGRFDFFPKLPVEIRVMIWEAYLNSYDGIPAVMWKLA